MQPNAPPSSSAILRDTLLSRVARNPSYSLRAFARDLGVSHAYLSLLLHGKRRLSVRRAIEFGQSAALDDTQLKALVAAAQAEEWQPALGSTGASSRRAREEYLRLELDRFRVLADWYHLALLDLTLLEGFRSDPRWVARRLGITVPQVRAAVARLSRLGLLSTQDGKWKKLHAKLEVPSTNPSRALLQFHEQMIRKALEAAQSSAPEDYEARDITGVTLPINPARLPGAKRRIRRFRHALLNYLTEGKRTELYQMNVQLFRLTRPEKTRRRK